MTIRYFYLNPLQIYVIFLKIVQSNAAEWRHFFILKHSFKKCLELSVATFKAQKRLLVY